MYPWSAAERLFDGCRHIRTVWSSALFLTHMVAMGCRFATPNRRQFHAPALSLIADMSRWPFWPATPAPCAGYAFQRNRLLFPVALKTRPDARGRVRPSIIAATADGMTLGGMSASPAGVIGSSTSPTPRSSRSGQASCRTCPPVSRRAVSARWGRPFSWPENTSDKATPRPPAFWHPIDPGSRDVMPVLRSGRSARSTAVRPTAASSPWRSRTSATRSGRRPRFRRCPRATFVIHALGENGADGLRRADPRFDLTGLADIAPRRSPSRNSWT